VSARIAPRAPGPRAFPRARWVALGWLAVWTAGYARGYPLANFLQLCDLAVIVTCLGLWLGSPLLVSMQALSSLLIDLAWDVDVLWRAASGRHLLGGTEYMWDAKIPLWLRLLSLFHVAWPPLVWWALRGIGYDRRALAAQTALAAAVLALSRVAMPEANINFAHRDPFVGRSWGPAPVHVLLTVAGLFVLVYGPTHLVLRRAMPSPRA
jgi:hypothetical protein